VRARHVARPSRPAVAGPHPTRGVAEGSNRRGRDPLDHRRRLGCAPGAVVGLHVAGNVVHILLLVALVIEVYNLCFGNRAIQA
jgi:hypothetical protein